MHGGLWRNPYMQKNSPNIPSHKQSISNRKSIMEHGYLLYVLDELISNLLSSLPLKISAFQLRCLRHQRVDHKRFPAWISGNPGSTWIIQIQYDVWQDRPTFRQSQRQYNSVLRIISDVGDSVRRVRGTAYGDQIAHLAWVPYIDLRLSPTWWRKHASKSSVIICSGNGFPPLRYRAIT